jgi:hypothetical protein
MEHLIGLAGGQLKMVMGLAIVVLGGFRWLIGRRDLQFVHRREFLQYWKNPWELDALSVEVLSRQLFGAYLPAAVVRRVCDRSGAEVCRMLGDLADVWSLVEWDQKTQRVNWKAKAASDTKRAKWNLAFWAIYFVSAFSGAMILFVLIAGSTNVSISASVASSLWGIILIAVSGVALWRTDAWAAAARLGDGFLEDVNRLAVGDREESHPGPGERLLAEAKHAVSVPN